MKKNKGILAGTIITSAMAFSTVPAATQPLRIADENQSEMIVPFQVHVSNADLDDLRRRVLSTRWPSKETVTDPSQGVQLATMQKLAQYWGTDYDWRKVEARLNALPQFTTKIDDVDIHFIWVRSKHKNALPVIITHGWTLAPS